VGAGEAPAIGGDVLSEGGFDDAYWGESFDDGSAVALVGFVLAGKGGVGAAAEPMLERILGDSLFACLGRGASRVLGICAICV